MVDILYAPILGQSNGRNMKNFVGDEDAGYTLLESSLSHLTGLTVKSAFEDAAGDPIALAVGGSAVDGDRTKMSDSKIWWYPDSARPGGALLNALEIMHDQYDTLAQQGEVKITLIWSQGEHAAEVIGAASDKDAEAARYLQATQAIFDYIQADMGVPVDFYLMQTDYLNEMGALNEGISQQVIDNIQDGVSRVRSAQENLAGSHGNVHLAVNYDDLLDAFNPLDADKFNDKWHLAADSYEVVGLRLAEYIAGNLGYMGGGTGEDRYLKGSIQADTLRGGLADDYIFGGQGDDNLRGDEGNDYISGEEGADILRGDAGNDTLIGGAGDDRFYGDAGDDFMRGDAGDDNLKGNTGNDVLIGGDGNDILRGEDDNDYLIGGLGRDKLIGGDGADIFRFFTTAESVRTGSQYDGILDFQKGSDIIDLSGLGFTHVTEGDSAAGELRLLYSANSDRTYVLDDHGSDFLFYLSGDWRGNLNDADFVFGSPALPPVSANEGEALIGTLSDDKLIGTAGNDTLLGLAGKDTLTGGDGNDLLDGGMDQDRMYGGNGADVFRFSYTGDSVRGPSAARSYDSIMDFEHGVDKIDLSALAFTGLGTAEGELRIEYSAGSNRTYLRDDFGSDFEFYLQGDYRNILSENDFVF